MRKDGKSMKYTEKVMETVKNTLARVEAITGELNELEQQFKAERISGFEYTSKKKMLEDQRADLMGRSARDLNGLYQAYEQAVKNGAMLDASKIHDDAKILQLNMTMTPYQFEQLVEKHRDNTLMCQLLQEYSNNHKGMYASFIPTPEVRIAAFYDFVGAARTAIRTPDTMQGALFLDGHYTPVHCTESE